MDAKYEALFTPWKVGNVEIKNRIVMCPMGGTSLFGWFELGGCHFDKEAAKLFLERAQNNVGLIIPGIAPLRDTFWGKWLWQNPKMFDDLKAYMEEIHKTGAKLFIQLTAGMGRSWAITELVGPLHKNKLRPRLLRRLPRRRRPKLLPRLPRRRLRPVLRSATMWSCSRRLTMRR